MMFPIIIGSCGSLSYALSFKMRLKNSLRSYIMVENYYVSYMFTISLSRK